MGVHFYLTIDETGEEVCVGGKANYYGTDPRSLLHFADDVWDTAADLLEEYGNQDKIRAEAW